VPLKSHLPIPWKKQVVNLIRGYAAGTKFTYDKVRTDATLSGIEPPKNVNAWGGAMQSAHAEGLVERTGQYIQATKKSSHARMLPVWVRL